MLSDHRSRKLPTINVDHDSDRVLIRHKGSPYMGFLSKRARLCDFDRRFHITGYDKTRYEALCEPFFFIIDLVCFWVPIKDIDHWQYITKSAK